MKPDELDAWIAERFPRPVTQQEAA
jgi:hypothetical protein